MVLFPLETCCIHFLLQEIHSVGKEVKTRATYLGIVLEEHGSFCLAKDASFGRVIGSGGKVVILDYQKQTKKQKWYFKE